MTSGVTLFERYVGERRAEGARGKDPLRRKRDNGRLAVFWLPDGKRAFAMPLADF